MENRLMGYPSVDRPWLKYYSENAIDVCPPEKTLYEYLWESNKAHLDSVALIYGNKTYTYGAMFERIEGVARSFAALGVAAGDVVTLLLLHTPESVFCFYALSKLGATVNYINVLSTKDEVSRYLEECGGKYLVSLDIFADKIPRDRDIKAVSVSLVESLGIVEKAGYWFKKRKIPAFGMSWRQFCAQGRDYLPATYHPEHIAVLGHTGGTTGLPKGLLIRDHAMNGVAQEYKNSFFHSRGQRFLCAVIPFVLYGLCVNLHMPLCLGLETVLIPKIDMEKVDELFIKYRPNHVGSVPSVWAALASSVKMDGQDLSYLITVAAGGDGMTIELENAVNAFIAAHNGNTSMKKGYGMSEVCATACTHTDAAPSKGNDVGIPWPSVIISAFDTDTQKEKTYGEKGEICIFSPFAMDGYLNAPEETAQTMRMHEDGRVWIHTGDIGYVDADGYVFITGRIKRLFVVRQEGIAVKVFPDQIEKAVMQSGCVRECCAVPVADREKYNRVRVFAVPKDDLDRRELIQNVIQVCREKLPAQYIPDDIVLLSQLPLTAVGKIDYRRLEKMGADGQTADER